VSAGLDALIPELQPYAHELVRAAGAAGLFPRVTSTLRTYAEQKRLYDHYLQGLSPYPAAPPGHSAHEYGYAFDMVVAPIEDLVDVGEYWESLGGIWGGRKGDDVHFEYPGFRQAYGRLVSQAQNADENSPGLFGKAVSFGASLLVPVPVSLGVSLGEFVQTHPSVRPLINNLIGEGLPITDLWDWELNSLPTWLRDIL